MIKYIEYILNKNKYKSNLYVCFHLLYLSYFLLSSTGDSSDKNSKNTAVIENPNIPCET